VRLTVDTAADLEQMRALYGATTSVMPSVGELIAAWDRTERRSVA
jgi:spore coat polysaccharide biosynthesis protein SpsF (cytidylyltransferase family)